MTDAPKVISLLPDDGWSWMYGVSPHEPDSICYIRADAPELVALVDAVRDVLHGENWRMGKKFDPSSGSFDLSTQRAALAAWDGVK